jgi:hypothetical protein
VGWSKTYLQLTHTTCLTKHKPKGNEGKKKKKKKAKTGSAVKEKKQNNGAIFFFHQMKYAKSMTRRFADYQGEGNKVE